MLSELGQVIPLTHDKSTRSSDWERHHLTQSWQILFLRLKWYDVLPAVVRTESLQEKIWFLNRGAKSLVLKSSLKFRAATCKQAEVWTWLRGKEERRES